MNELDLTDWSKEIDKQIRNAKIQNEKSFRACKSCGDSGVILSKESSNGMYYLCCNYCDCNTGQNLRNKHNQKNVQE